MNSEQLRRRAAERREAGWEISDAMLPQEMEDLAGQLDRAFSDWMMLDAVKRENAALREKVATLHRLLCEANAHLAKTSRGDDKDVDKAASTVALAIRTAA